MQSLIVMLDALTVPLACDNVNCVPGIELPMLIDGLPAMANVPAVLVEPAENLTAVEVSVSVLVAPMVSASANATVAPVVDTVTGISNVFPLVVTV